MKLVKGAKIAYIVSSALLMCLGLVLIIWPAIGLKIACYIVGALAILFGVAKILGYFSKDLFRLAFQFDFTLGIIAILLGILTIILPSVVDDEIFAIVLAYIVGIYTIIDGIAKIQTSVDAKRFGFVNWWVLILLAALTCAAGVLLLIFPLIGAEVVLVMTGVSLLVDGIENICTVAYMVKVFKNFKPENLDSEND